MMALTKRKKGDADMVLQIINREDGVRSYAESNDGTLYCVDTANTFDSGPETMIFRCNKNGTVKWRDSVYTERHDNMEDAFSRHRIIAEDVSDYVYRR